MASTAAVPPPSPHSAARSASVGYAITASTSAWITVANDGCAFFFPWPLPWLLTTVSLAGDLSVLDEGDAR